LDAAAFGAEALAAAGFAGAGFFAAVVVVLGLAAVFGFAAPAASVALGSVPALAGVFAMVLRSPELFITALPSATRPNRSLAEGRLGKALDK
jgi:hypothetical protein